MPSLPLLLAWTAVFVSCGFTLGKNINSFAGPYIAYAHRFDVCPSDGTAVGFIKNSRFNPVRPFERQWIRMNVSLRTVFDDSFWFRATLAIRSNNEWKENAFVFDFPGGGCSALREHVPSFFHILSTFAPEVRDKRTPCQFQPDYYLFENQTVRWEFPKFKIMPYGHYRFTLTGGKGSRVKKICQDVDAEIIPKPQ